MERQTAVPEVDSVPGDRAERWISFHHRHAAPSEHGHDFVWDVEAEAIGPFCTDIDGNVFLDFTSHIGAAPLGYNNPKVLEPLGEFDLVDPLKTAGQDFYSGSGADPDHPSIPGASQLMERLVETTEAFGMDTVFLSNSGAEAIENAAKIAYADSRPSRYAVTFRGAFHGRTLGALSLTKADSTHLRGYPQLAGVETVPFCADRTCGRADCDCGFFAGDRSVLAESLHPERGHLPADEVAFLILEPVQGVGGYNVPSEAFVGEVQRLCDEHDIHLVVDEIQSGVGRTGSVWASETLGLEPDIIASAKALRVGATISREEVFPAESGRLGSTWGGGDILGSMLGCFTLDAIEEHDLLANARDRGRQFRETVRDAEAEGVVDVRGPGLMLAVEFDSAARRDSVVREAFASGLLIVGCGRKAVRVLPSLDVTEREIRLGASMLLDAIRDASGPS